MVGKETASIFFKEVKESSAVGLGGSIMDGHGDPLGGAEETGLFSSTSAASASPFSTFASGESEAGAVAAGTNTRAGGGGGPGSGSDAVGKSGARRQGYVGMEWGRGAVFTAVIITISIIYPAIYLIY